MRTQQECKTGQPDRIENCALMMVGHMKEMEDQNKIRFVLRDKQENKQENE